MERKVLVQAARAGDLARVQALVPQLAGQGAEGGVDEALIAAARLGRLEVVRYLVGHCNVNVDANVEHGGYSALVAAAENGKLGVVRFLVQQGGAAVNATNDAGDTALMCAATWGEADVVRFLVQEGGADVHVANRSGKTAACLADRGQHHEITRMLTLLLPVGHRPRVPVVPSATVRSSVSVATSSHIPPSEIELSGFCPDGSIGGDFRAKWLDVDAVVKLFIPDASQASFDAELRLWQRLRHPNVLKMYGACTAGPVVRFFVCEYASQGSLWGRVRLSSSVQCPATWKYLHEAALGLEYLHERGIIHGSLRCGNIFIGSDGIAKLSNFGLSSSLERRGSGGGELARWLAPEVLRGEPPSRESDVYSLGMCILEAATGKAPWSNRREAAVKICKRKWKPETEENSRYAPERPAGAARELVWQMCRQEPRLRPSLSSVVYKIERVGIEESCSQPEHEPAISFDEYNGGQLKQSWLKLETYMGQCSDLDYRHAYSQLRTVRERLRGAKPHSTLLVQFHALLKEFYSAVKISPEQVRIMRLSSTRATSSSLYAIQRRINLLLSALGDSVAAGEERWQRQGYERIDRLVGGASDTFLLLNDLRSDEDRLTFLKALEAKMQMPLSAGEYTNDEVGAMKEAYKAVVATKLNPQRDLAPEWFIPWYELVVDEWACLGEGGFGSVYRAKWLDSNVVVKRVLLAGVGTKSSASTNTFESCWSASEDLSPTQAQVDTSKRAKGLAMFRREVDIWFGFSHPHVIRLFGACHVGRPFFVCEYATNGTLVRYLREHPSEVWLKLHEAALGVQYLHARDVVHGDLKGNNIVIGGDLKAKVTDFGLSSVATSEEDKAIVSGAWHWVAPVLLDTASRPTFASDVYSLGMCIVEALRVVEAVESGNKSGLHCLPWRVGDRAAVKYHAMCGKLPSRPSTCKEEQWDLIVRMCQLEPDKRIKISAVVDALAKLATPEPHVTSQVDAATEWGSIPDEIAAAHQKLSRLELVHSDHDEDKLGKVSPVYVSLWKRLEHVRERIGDEQSDACRAAFCSLVAEARVSTVKLQHGESNLISLTESTMRWYALDRALSKLCDAYFIVCEDFEGPRQHGPLSPSAARKGREVAYVTTTRADGRAEPGVMRSESTLLRSLRQAEGLPKMTNIVSTSRDVPRPKRRSRCGCGK